MNVKKDLSKPHFTNRGLGNIKVYINLNFCPYYKLLWSKSKRLHAKKQIHSYYISNGTVKVKVEENSRFAFNYAYS